MLNVTHMAALLVRLLPLIHVLSQRHLVLRVSNIARAIKYKPNVQCWEKYPGASWGCCLPEVCFCYKKEMRPGSTHQAVRRGMFSGQWKEELGLIGNLSHSPSTPFLHPLVSLHELLAFVYVRGDKTQTRNGNGSERGWVCGAVLEVAGCDSSTCIWHLAIHRLFSLCSVWIPRGWFILTREPIAFFFFNAKHLLCKMWETRGKVHFFLIFGKNSLLLPTPCPILHSWDRDFPMRNFAFVT